MNIIYTIFEFEVDARINNIITKIFTKTTMDKVLTYIRHNPDEMKLIKGIDKSEEKFDLSNSMVTLSVIKKNEDIWINMKNLDEIRKYLIEKVSNDEILEAINTPIDGSILSIILREK